MKYYYVGSSERRPLHEASVYLFHQTYSISRRADGSEEKFESFFVGANKDLAQAGEEPW